MLNVTELHQAIKSCYEARIPLLIRGGPGIAKTDIVNQIAQEYAVDFAPFNAGTMDPSSFGITIPRADNSACDIIPTAEFVDVKPGGIVFLDEMDKLDTLIQNAMLPMIQNNRINGRELSDRWHVMAANRMSDGKGTFEISSILRNRVCVVDFEGPTVQEWTTHASKCGIDYRVISFLNQPQYMNLLNAYDPKADSSPTPRQWFKVSRIIDSPVRNYLCFGLVGAKATAEFEVFMKITSKLPSWAALVASNGSFKIPDEFVLQSIIATMIGQNMDGNTAQAVKPIIDQLPVEFIVVALRLAVTRNAPGIQQFIVKNNYVPIMHKAMTS